jgi:hypothetical protein
MEKPMPVMLPIPTVPPNAVANVERDSLLLLSEISVFKPLT